jgi:hypothetical protein
MIVIPRLDRGIQKILDCPVEPDNDNIYIACGFTYGLLLMWIGLIEYADKALYDFVYRLLQ